MPPRILATLLLSLLLATGLRAQDTIAVSAPRVPFSPIPKKAALYSAILPGLGQIYNRQYWKLPIIYGGLGVAAYFIQDNLSQYQRYRSAYINRLTHGGPETLDISRYNTSDLQQLQDGYKKYLDMTVLYTTLGYALQVMDALAFAHLYNFDISRNISLKVRPVAAPGGIGFGLVASLH